MKLTIKKTDTIEYLLSLIFIINLFVSEISNYKSYSFYLKGISSVVLLLLVWSDYKLNNIEFAKTNQINLKTFSTALFLFILIPTLSLIYSHNIEFGIMKTVYILISVILSIFVFLYFLISANNKRIKIFLNTILVIGFLFGMASLIFSPYNPAIGYSFELSRWSHVIAGRFLSSITVILLLLHFTTIVKSKISLIAITTTLLVSTYFVGMRAAFLGILILIISLILHALIQKKREALISISLALLFSITAVLLIGEFNKISTDRYNKLITNEAGEFDDGAINARLIAYKMSWKNIKKYPFYGVGFGGFNNKEISGDIAEIKYPHNLLIEIQLELGIFGTIFFGILLSLIFWRAYKFSIPPRPVKCSFPSYFMGLVIFLIFSFWLAMFSKDIATQTQLWIGIAVLGVGKRSTEEAERRKGSKDV